MKTAICLILALFIVVVQYVYFVKDLEVKRETKQSEHCPEGYELFLNGCFLINKK